MDKLITPESGLVLWTLITFGLLLVLLRLFAWKPLLAVIEVAPLPIRPPDGEFCTPIDPIC